MIVAHRTFLVLGGICFFALAVARASDDVPDVTTVAVPHGMQVMAAKRDAAGIIHLVCDSPDGPQYLSFKEDGHSFSRPLAIVDDASRQPRLEFNVWSLAVSPEGTVHVALGNNAWKLKLPRDEWGFFYARLEPNAKAFSPLQNINGRPSEGFSLAAGESNNVTACWLADKLFANISRDSGQTFDPTIEIDSSFNPCNCCTTNCCYAADGRLAILYREETGDNRDMFLVLWDQNANRATRKQISSTLWQIDACPMTYYSISATREGFVAAWPTRGQIYLARLDADGDVLPPGEIKTPGQCGMRTGLITLTDSADNTLVVWKKDGQLGWQLYDERGQPLGQAGSAPSAGNGAAGVVGPRGFVLFR